MSVQSLGPGFNVQMQTPCEHCSVSRLLCFFWGRVFETAFLMCAFCSLFLFGLLLLLLLLLLILVFVSPRAKAKLPSMSAHSVQDPACKWRKKRSM